MRSLFELENKYLTAKIAYYNGKPIMSDSEFDKLEQLLKDKGSKVIDQVGSKSKDYDFAHPTKMLSLSKIQNMKLEDETTDYKFIEFKQWYNKRLLKVGKCKLKSSPKFDGNAINTIYIGGKFTSVITRGDGEYGKDVTAALKYKFPNEIIMDGFINDDDVLEIRSEVVIDKFLFDEKYSKNNDNNDKMFANPRNYVAGVIGKDNYDLEKVLELDVLPLHFILNGVHISDEVLMQNELISSTRYEREYTVDEYIDAINYYEGMRSSFKYQLDGVVFSLPVEVRGKLGQNSHDPEWSVAIKFVAEEVTATYRGIVYSISKTGEFTPVVLLEPVELCGTIVRRANGYNYGYIVENKIGKGSQFKIRKSGEIIPQIISILSTSNEELETPKVCPNCNTTLEIDDIHLLCPNDECGGKIAKQLSRNCKLIKLKGIGPKTIEYFSDDFENLVDVIYWVRTKGNSDEIQKYGFNFESKSHINFMDSFKAIKSVTYAQVIVMMGYDNVGLKLSEQIANMYFGLPYDTKGQTKVLVGLLSSEEVKTKIMKSVKKLEDCGVVVDIPQVKVVSDDAISVCMTGSPKDFGFDTKAKFVEAMGGNLIDVSISSKECKYLITDDLNSTSSKMKTAAKKGIEIFTYGDFYNKFK